jgi:hypothetical protein
MVSMLGPTVAMYARSLHQIQDEFTIAKMVLAA